MNFDNKNTSRSSHQPPDNYDLRREVWLIAYALASFQIVETLSVILAESLPSDDSPQYFGMVNTIYIVYGRPFHRCAGIGWLEKSDIPVTLHAMHDHMMTFRDKIFGHKDSAAPRIDENYTANEVRAVVGKDGQMKFFCTEFRVRSPLMPDIHKHVSALQAHFSQRQRELIAKLLPSGKLPDGGYLYDGEFILSVDWREDAPFKRVPDSDAYLYGKR